MRLIFVRALSKERLRPARILLAVVLGGALTNGQAATFTIKDSQFQWAVMRQVFSNSVDFLATGPQVGISGATRLRSVLDFDLRGLPATEKIVSATLNLSPRNFTISGVESIGSIRHLDATVPPRISGRPIDPFRFPFDSLTTASLVGDLHLGLDLQYDVTAAVAQDHLAGHSDSPLALVENNARSSNLGIVGYTVFPTTPQLVVETAPAEALGLALESLGGNRYRASYSLRNEVSVPLSLIDIEFDPALYREDTLLVSLTDGAAADWSALLLNSGIGVPAVLSLAANGEGLRGGALRFQGGPQRFEQKRQQILAEIEGHNHDRHKPQQRVGQPLAQFFEMVAQWHDGCCFKR